MTKIAKPAPTAEKAMADAISYLLANALAHGMPVTVQALELALVGVNLEGHKLAETTTRA